MKLLHLSDTHGLIPELDLRGVDVVVHSGDILPNRTRGFAPIEENFQNCYLHAERERYRKAWGGIPFLFVTGNHEFIDPTKGLLAAGVDAINLNNTTVTIKGVTFRGFHYTPYFNGEWADELQPIAMRYAVQSLEPELAGVDVLVSHGPLYNVLDRNAQGVCCGNKPLCKMMKTMASPPRYFLHGHLHESHGFRVMKNFTVFNSATIQQIVEV